MVIKMEHFLNIKNTYGEVQLTDEVSAYFFLKEVVTLGKYYQSTSSKCSCVWNDGTITAEAYNYRLAHTLDEKILFVIKNETEKEVRLCVSPLAFDGTPSFHVSATGCTQEEASALKVYVFSSDTSIFFDDGYGLALFDKDGKHIYNSSWRPLKITNGIASDEAWNESFAINSEYGVILNSGYRNASEETITTGVWTTVTVSGTSKPTTFVPPNSIAPGHFFPHYGGSGGFTEPLNIFPKEITYQGYILTSKSIKTQTFTGKAPIATTHDAYETVEEKTEMQYVPIWDDCASMVWDNCATISSKWDDCATTEQRYDPCASTDLITGACKPGFVTECKGGLVQECQGGLVCQGGYVNKLTPVTTVIVTHYDITTVEPDMDEPSLFYGMEAYPDGALFTRSSGTSTIAIVDLKNYPK